VKGGDLFWSCMIIRRETKHQATNLCFLAALRHIVSKVLLEESEGVTSFLDDFFIKNSSLWIGRCCLQFNMVTIIVQLLE